MTTILLPEQRPAFHLVADKTIEGEQFVTNFFNSLFDLKKLVLVKQSHKDKHLIKEVVIILNSQNNIEMLSQGSLNISDTKFTCKEIPVDTAEQLIRQNKTKLYVGNIPKGVDNIKLWKHFARFGALDYTYIIKKPDRNSRGFGFIIYEERDSFERAVKSKHYIDGQRLICKLFLNKSQLTKHSKFDGGDSPADESEQHQAEVEIQANPEALSCLPQTSVDPQTSILNCLDDEEDYNTPQEVPVKASTNKPSVQTKVAEKSISSTSSSTKKASSTLDSPCGENSCGYHQSWPSQQELAYSDHNQQPTQLFDHDQGYGSVGYMHPNEGQFFDRSSHWSHQQQATPSSRQRGIQRMNQAPVYQTPLYIDRPQNGELQHQYAPNWRGQPQYAHPQDRYMADLHHFHQQEFSRYERPEFQFQAQRWGQTGPYDGPQYSYARGQNFHMNPQYSSEYHQATSSKSGFVQNPRTSNPLRPTGLRHLAAGVTAPAH